MSSFQDLRTAIATRLGIKDAADEDRPRIDTWINEGISEIVMRTHCKVHEGSFDLQADVSDYELDDSIIAMLDVYVTASGKPYRLKRVSPVEIIDRRVLSNDTDSPATLYATNGSNMLMLYPTPAGADTVTTLYVRRPDALVAADDVPTDIPTEFHKAIEYYALWQGADDEDDQTSAQGSRYRDEYEEWLLKIRRALRDKGGRKLSPARVGHKPFASFNPSTDLGD